MSIKVGDLGEKYNEEREIILSRSKEGFELFCQEWKGEGKNFLSPFRDERTPSASIYKSDKGYYCFKDFGGGEHLNLIDFVMKKEGLDFNAAFVKIKQALNIDVEVKPEFTISCSPDLKEYEAAYLKDFGISLEVCKKFNVVSVDQYSSVTKDGKPYTITSKPDDFILSYKINDNYYKIYRPVIENKKFKFSYLGVKPVNYAFGYDQLPESGEYVFIAAGEKDVLTLVSHNYPAMCFSSEAASPIPEIIKDLKSRFKNVILIYDIDQEGKKHTENFLKKAEVKVLSLPEQLVTKGIGKDVSDFFKAQYTFDHIDFIQADTFNNLIKETISKKEIVQPDKLGYTMTLNYQKKFTKPALTYQDASLMNPGEGATIVALPGVGKSQTFEAIGAEVVARNFNLTGDFLGFKSYIPLGKGVFIGDYERPFDINRDALGRIYNRLGCPEFIIDQETGTIKFLTYKCYIDVVGVEERKKALEEELSTGKYGLVLLDGILGLVNSMNDEEECNNTIQWLLSLAHRFDFGLVTSMHPNKGTDTMAGHIGGFLYRYSRACLVIKPHEHDKEVKCITNNFSQGKLSYGVEAEGYFRYSEEHRMFRTEENIPTSKPRENFSEAAIRKIFNEAFINGKSNITGGDLKKKYALELGKSEETAKKHISLAVDQVIKSHGSGKATYYTIIEKE